MTGGVIAEFLASVGFKADEKSLQQSLAKVAGFGVAISAVALGIFAGITKVASAEADLARKAEGLRTTADRLQEIGYVAQSEGAGIDAVTRSIDGLISRNPRIKDGAAALEKAGERMQRMTMRQRELFADRMGIDRALIPALIKDTKALKDEFRAMYGVAGVDAKAAGEASKGFMAELAKLGTIVSMLGRSVAITFITRIRGDVEALRRAIMENFGSIRRVFEVLIAVVLRITAAISAFVYRAIKFVSGLVQWFDKLDDRQRKLVVGLGLLLAAWRWLNLGFLATPLGMIVAGLAAIVALVDDYLTYMEGGEAYFDWGPWQESIEAVLAALKPLGPLVVGVMNGIIACFGPVKALFANTFSSIIQQIRLFGRLLKQLFTGDFAGAAETFKAMLVNMVDFGKQQISHFCDMVRAFFTAMWPSVQESFPSFAAWAEDQYQAIVKGFGKAFDWITKKFATLQDYMPDWVKDLFGSGDGGAPAKAQPQVGAGAPGANAQLPAGAGAPGANAQLPAGAGAPGGMTQPQATPYNPPQAALAPQGAALVPGQAQQAMYAAHTTASQTATTLNAKTEIHMHTTDPVVAGNQVAGRQAQVNADTVRHMRGVAR